MNWPAALLLLGLACAPGCRSSGKGPALLSEEAVVLELPLVEQDELHECGLAAVTALCGYHGVELAGPERAALAAGARERAGLSGCELKAALERAGFEVFLFQGTLDRSATGVFAHLDRGRPLLVLLGEGGDANHYVLLVGYDAPLDELILFDPRRGRVLQPASAFDRAWRAASRFTLLALPGGRGPHSPRT